MHQIHKKTEKAKHKSADFHNELGANLDHQTSKKHCCSDMKFLMEKLIVDELSTETNPNTQI